MIHQSTALCITYNDFRHFKNLAIVIDLQLFYLMSDCWNICYWEYAGISTFGDWEHAFSLLVNYNGSYVLIWTKAWYTNTSIIWWRTTVHAKFDMFYWWRRHNFHLKSFTWQVTSLFFIFWGEQEGGGWIVKKLH